MPLIGLVQTTKGAEVSKLLRPNQYFEKLERSWATRKRAAGQLASPCQFWMVDKSKNELDSRDLAKVGDVNSQVGVSTVRNAVSQEGEIWPWRYWLKDQIGE